MTEKQALAKQRPIRRQLALLAKQRHKLEGELHRIAKDYFDLKPDDLVHYDPGNPNKFIRGKVLLVEGNTSNSADSVVVGSVLVQTLKSGSNEPTKTEQGRRWLHKRQFIKRWHVAPAPAIQPAPAKITKIERTNWYDQKKGVPLYGIKAWDSANKRWMNVCEGIEPCIYATAEKRDAKLKELRAKAREKGGAE